MLKLNTQDLTPYLWGVELNSVRWWENKVWPTIWKYQPTNDTLLYLPMEKDFKDYSPKKVWVTTVWPVSIKNQAWYIQRWAWYLELQTPVTWYSTISFWACPEQLNKILFSSKVKDGFLFQFQNHQTGMNNGIWRSYDQPIQIANPIQREKIDQMHWVHLLWTYRWWENLFYINGKKYYSDSYWLPQVPINIIGKYYNNSNYDFLWHISEIIVESKNWSDQEITRYYKSTVNSHCWEYRINPDSYLYRYPLWKHNYSNYRQAKDRFVFIWHARDLAQWYQSNNPTDRYKSLWNNEHTVSLRFRTDNKEEQCLFYLWDSSLWGHCYTWWYISWGTDNNLLYRIWDVNDVIWRWNNLWNWWNFTDWKWHFAVFRFSINKNIQDIYVDGYNVWSWSANSNAMTTINLSAKMFFWVPTVNSTPESIICFEWEMFDMRYRNRFVPYDEMEKEYKEWLSKLPKDDNYNISYDANNNHTACWYKFYKDWKNYALRWVNNNAKWDDLNLPSMGLLWLRGKPASSDEYAYMANNPSLPHNWQPFTCMFVVKTDPSKWSNTKLFWRQKFEEEGPWNKIIFWTENWKFTVSNWINSYPYLPVDSVYTHITVHYDSWRIVAYNNLLKVAEWTLNLSWVSSSELTFYMWDWFSYMQDLVITVWGYNQDVVNKHFVAAESRLWKLVKI